MPSVSIPTQLAGLAGLLAAFALLLADIPGPVGGDGSQSAAQAPPLAFVPNRGQSESEVRYEARGPGFAFYFTRSKAVLAVGGQALQLRFAGASEDTRLVAGSKLPGSVNYLHGRDSADWQRGLPMYGEITYRHLWPGIDMTFRGAGGRLKYEFVVRAGARPDAIRLAYAGARRLSLTGAGAMLIHTPGGTLSDTRPRSFQRIDGRRVPVDSRFAVAAGSTRYGFELGAYDSTAPLVIDPGLAYSTFLAGGDDDIVADIAVDGTGSAYVMGGSQSFDYPATPGAFDTSNGTTTDAFVTKLSPSGSQVVYSTFLGGSAFDSALHSARGGIAVDRSGNAYVTGETDSTDFPTTPGAFDTTPTAGAFPRDVFVTKLNPTGTGLVYSTLLGGLERDVTNDIALDEQGNAYVTGSSQRDWPVTPGAFDTTRDSIMDEVAFVTKLNPTGSALVYSTLLHGTGFRDIGYGIAVDPGGHAYVGGETHGGFPTTPGAYDGSFEGPFRADGFVTKVDPTGAALVYSTYLGGTEDELVYDVDIDSAGSAYVAGLTASTNFPVTPGAYDQARDAASADAFVSKLDPQGATLAYSTYLGGEQIDLPREIVVDGQGSAYIGGQTLSRTFPVSPDAHNSVYKGGFDRTDGDGFVTQVDHAGRSLLHSTFVGGHGDDEVNSIALGPDGGLYITGETEASDFPTTPGAYSRTFRNGQTDGWVARLEVDRDFDDVLNAVDNCVDVANPDQRDTDADGIGDECDPTPGNTPCRVTANGRLAQKVRFNLHAAYDDGNRAPTGRASYTDRTVALSLRSLELTSLIVVDTHAILRGVGRTGGETVEFRIDLDDLGRARLDRFEISLSNGYEAAGNLRNGNVAIDCG